MFINNHNKSVINLFFSGIICWVLSEVGLPSFSQEWLHVFVLADWSDTDQTVMVGTKVPSLQYISNYIPDRAVFFTAFMGANTFVITLVL